MTDKRFRLLAVNAYTLLKNAAPVDTGNLKFAAVYMRQINANEYRIYVDGNLAPYAVYTNEQWVAPSWKKHRFRNPNYHWIDNAVQKIVGIAERRAKGEAKFDIKEVSDRYTNKSYWDSADGKRRLARYGMTFSDTLVI